MSATSGGSVSKASFVSLDISGVGFIVQYNPINFKFDKSVSWKEHENQGIVGSLEFQTLSPASMSCELTFDTTIDGSDVREVWVNNLLRFTNPEVTISGSSSSGDSEAATMTKQRPHKVQFSWEDFELIGVIETINVTYTMFSNAGVPVRAKVQVKMKEWAAETGYQASGASASYFTSEMVKLTTVQAGETITGVADRTNSDWREVADQNDIDNPMELDPGTPIAHRPEGSSSST